MISTQDNSDFQRNLNNGYYYLRAVIDSVIEDAKRKQLSAEDTIDAIRNLLSSVAIIHVHEERK